MGEQPDAEDTLRWLRTAPWWNGALGLFGISYGVYASLGLLGRANDGERFAAVWVSGFSDPYQVVYRNGVLQLHWALPVTFIWSGQNGALPKEIDWERMWQAGPAGPADSADSADSAGPGNHSLGLFRRWRSHPHRDSFWDDRTLQLPEQAPPTLHITGLNDFLVDSALELYANSPEPKRLILGPWDHNSVVEALQSDVVNAHTGEADPSTVNLASILLSWFDAWLKEDRQTTPDLPGSRMHAAGEGWRNIKIWPPQPVHAETFHLAFPGQLSPAPSRTNRIRVINHDPDNLVRTSGGAVWALKDVVKPGPGSLEHLTGRRDVLRFSGDPWPAERVVAGAPKVRLALWSSRPVPCHVRLADGDSQGRLQLVTDGVGSLPGGFSVQEIKMLPAVHRFAAGHHPHLLISASDFPRYEPAPTPVRIKVQLGTESRLELPCVTCG